MEKLSIYDSKKKKILYNFPNALRERIAYKIMEDILLPLDIFLFFG
jgi:hypothetical protein